MGRRGLIAIALLSLPVACGGRVLEETPDQPATKTDASTPTPTNQATTGNSSNGSGSDGLGAPVALPDCVLGGLASKMDPISLPTTCQYTYEGRCYATKLKACACACPNKPGTVCSSGFPSDDGTTLVTCG